MTRILEAVLALLGYDFTPAAEMEWWAEPVELVDRRAVSGQAELGGHGMPHNAIPTPPYIGRHM